MAKPHFPTAAITLSKSEITLPENSITVDASASTDPDKNGVVERWQWGGEGIVYDNPAAKVTKAMFAKDGNYSISLIVWDHAGHQSELVSVPVVVNKAKAVTVFGGKVIGLSVSDQMTVITELGLKAYRTSVELTTWNGGSVNAIDEALSKGLRVLLTINWEAAGQVRKFPVNMVAYSALLDKFLSLYGARLIASKSVVNCENEPTTDAFFNDTIDHYITELRTFVDVCNKHGVECTDGCIFIEWVNAIRTGAKLKPNGVDNQTMLLAYKDIPMTYVNTHFVVKGSDLPDIKAACDYITQVTGKPTMSNEHHYENSTPDMVTKVVQAAKDAGMVFCSVWLDGFNTGTVLTKMGDALKKAVV